ncbi:hypothetical protein E1B28_013765 [Marasmius oreades]|uniref:Uncharacterized protein n=1 Tax=Marasmius oreades TaxID=181124 RepID=A0A9P7UPB9_9AGAR|nr:uncharacterized protein E1B28_013765 [Marasmius oreades]KAG7087826.1 hypothetical protein E1B28_013765 [Marasmius oreades]
MSSLCFVPYFTYGSTNGVGELAAMSSFGFLTNTLLSLVDTSNAYTNLLFPTPASHSDTFGSIVAFILALCRELENRHGLQWSHTSSRKVSEIEQMLNKITPYLLANLCGILSV